MLKKTARPAFILIVVLLLSLLVIAPVQAADMRSGEHVTVAAGEVIDDDLYLSGQNIVMDGTVNGDLVAAGGQVTVNGTVKGSITVAGQNVVIRGRVGNSVRAAGSTVTINGEVAGDLVAFGATVTTSAESSIGRDLFTDAGSLHLNGPLGRNLKGSVSKLIINNKVGGNVDVEAGEVTLKPAASIKGSFQYKSEVAAVQESGAVIGGEVKHTVPEKKDTGFGCQPGPKAGEGQPSAGEKVGAGTIGAIIGAALSAFFTFMLVLILVGIVIRYAMALVTGIVLILMLHRYLPGLIETIKSKPWPCLGYGALKFFIGPLFIAVLLITIVGIPLGLIALALYLIIVYLASILFALFLGKWMLRQPAEVSGTGPLIGALALGLLVLHACQLLPGIGLLAWLAAVLFGLGMMVLYARARWLS